MTTTIPTVTQEANDLFAGLTAGFNLDLNLPDLEFNTDFEVPPQTGPAYADVQPIDIAALTTGTVDGSGVFDVMMKAVGAHLEAQAQKNRITGAEYAKVYLGGVHAVLQYGVQFLLGKDRTYWENLQLQAALRLAQAQEVRALADIQIARATIQQMAYQVIETKAKAALAVNQYALTKIELVTGYNGILTSEAQIKLLVEQVDAARAQTKETLADGTPLGGILASERILTAAKARTAEEELDSIRAQTKDVLEDGQPVKGILGFEKGFKQAQMVQMEIQGELTQEQLEAARAQTRETLSDGSSVMGVIKLEKDIKQAQALQLQEQYEAARGQVRDTLSTGAPIGGLIGLEKLIKMAQKGLTEEQHDTQRAQTKETLLDGSPVEGIAKHEKLLKAAQAKLVDEQYESQRGQTRGTLSDGTVVGGMIGAQTALYNQQVISYKRDAETKVLKMVMDTWTARKTIDEGVAVPTQIDTSAIDQMMSALRSNVDLL